LLLVLLHACLAIVIEGKETYMHPEPIILSASEL
jgi:hypothetical protein